MGDALGLCHKAQIFLRRHIHVQRRLLRQIADELFGLHGFLCNGMPINQHLAVRCAQTAGDDVHGRGFARAIRPQESIHHAFFNGK